MLLYLMQCFKFWIDLKLPGSCVGKEIFGVCETGRIERKGPMSHEAVVKVAESKEDVFGGVIDICCWNGDVDAKGVGSKCQIWWRCAWRGVG